MVEYLSVFAVTSSDC